jgi:hypothetical protein
MKKLTKEALAEKLTNRQRGKEITKEVEILAKENNLIFVFGASDDLIEICGAFNDEFSLELGERIVITKNGSLISECLHNDENYICPYFSKICDEMIKNKTAFEIKAYYDGRDWNGKEVDPDFFQAIGKPDWFYIFDTTIISAATFYIFEDDDDDKNYYCRGLVFDLDDLSSPDSK